MNHLTKYYFTACFFLGCLCFGQNEAKKWYFGGQAGLDFTTNPPTVLTNGAMTAYYSCSSIADASGNILFYTDGATVWNSSHQVMANGTGLLGWSSSSQGSIIVKKPGSTTLYYIFTTGSCWNCTTGFNYSIVDMSLASGQGSVTVKNSNLYSGYLSSRVTATKHCNGTDIWVVTRDWIYTGASSSGTFTPNFKAYLLTSAGVSTTAINSPGSTFTYTWSGSWYDWGCMKLSPNGQKLGVAYYNNWAWNGGTNNTFELYDFDNTTGVVSNSLALAASTTSSWGGWGCEFSPDGTKFYATRWNGSNSSNCILQWDLCAGSPTAVASSAYTVSSNNVNSVGTLQAAINGKIYSTNWNQSSLGVIGNPNSAGAACNFSLTGQSVSPKTSYYSLPNLMSSNFLQHPTPPPFTHTVSNAFGCQGVGFTAPFTPSTYSMIGCAASGYSLTGMQWDFGDPASGSANTSTLSNPIHAYTTLGTYTAQLVLYYSCGGGTDTIKAPINVNVPCISVSSTSITCANLGSATVTSLGGIGPFSYTWMPTNQTSSVATGLSPGGYTLTIFDFGNNYTYTASTYFNSLIPLTGNLNNSSSVTCNGAATGTANFTNLAGGSGSQNYMWTNGAVTYTTPNPNTLSAGLWTAVVTDALTGCLINQVFLILQPPPLSLNLSSSSPTACAGTSVTLTGTNSGGTPYSSGAPYTYIWSGGPATDSYVATQAFSGLKIYTLTSKDSYSCSISNTIAIDYIVNPVLSLSSVSICPLQTGTLVVSGASTYTWNTSLTGNTLTGSPPVTTQYSVIGSALSCTSAASASIIVKPLPVPLLNSNGPICNGQLLQLFGGGGGFNSSYVWTGPLSFTSNLAYPVINPANPSHSGVYNVTVTAGNSCTAATSGTVTVNPTPSVTAAGSTVCVNQTMNLASNSVPGATYFWSGPLSYSSTLQNPFLNNPSVNRSGFYTVVATSPAGCTNVAVAHITVTAMPIVSIASDSPKCYGAALNFTSAGGVSYNWTGPNGFNSSVQNPVIPLATLPANGIYTLVVTTGPCVTSATHSVTIWALPSPTIASNSPVCETKSLSLGVSVNAGTTVTSYVWSGPNGFINMNQNTGLDSCQLIYSGIYTVDVTDAHGCQNNTSYSVTILRNPIVTAAGATVCLNQPAVLKASGAVSYIWSGPNYYVSYQASALIPGATSSVVTVYTVVGTAANTCTGITQASLTTMELPPPALSVVPKTRVCLNSTLNMEGFGGNYYEWRGPGNFMYKGKNMSFVASSLAYAGTYTLQVTDAKGCSSYTTVTIDLDMLPQGSLVGSKMQACVPFCSDFNFTSPLSSSLITTQWNLDGKTYSAKSFSHCFVEAGDYLITGKFTDTLTSCVKNETFVVNAYPLPVAAFDFSPEKPVENLDEVIFTNTSSGENINKWNWYFVSNEGYTTSRQNTSYLFKDAGSYPVAMVVKNTWGCADSIVKTVQVEKDFTVYVPNAFTPNGDNTNETFLPVGRGIKFYSLSIFDRWGTRVFQTTDENEGWDGTYQDQNCKSDVYTWKINVSSLSGEKKEMTGHVTLYR